MAAPQTYIGNGLSVTIADPENITRDECLQLARSGRVAWNNWRSDFPSRKNSNGVLLNTANFAVVDFRGLIVDFSGFEFGDGASFRNSKFADGVNFSDSRFGIEADFGASCFDGYSYFDDTQFGNLVNFDCTHFRTGVSFVGSVFADWAKLSGAQIGRVAWFSGVRFGNSTRFTGTQFGGDAHFDGATFGSLTRFDGAQFGGICSFRCVEFDDGITFAGLDWAAVKPIYRSTHESSKNWADELGISPDRFGRVVFDGSSFCGSVDFSGRVFPQPALFSVLRSDVEFKRARMEAGEALLNEQRGLILGEVLIPKGGPTRFSVAPRFHECKLHQDTSFDGAIFPSPWVAMLPLALTAP